MSLDKELDVIYDTVDEHLLSRNFETVDKILREINVEETHNGLLLGYLTVTLWARRELYERKDFFRKVFYKLAIIEETPPKELFGMLGGLS